MLELFICILEKLFNRINNQQKSFFYFKLHVDDRKTVDLAILFSVYTSQ